MGNALFYNYQGKKVSWLFWLHVTEREEEGVSLLFSPSSLLPLSAVARCDCSYLRTEPFTCGSSPGSSTMGNSASSLLDETKSNSIKGQAEAVLTEFSPYYRKQFSLARFSQVEDDLEQRKEKITQLLKQREAAEEGEVLYEDRVLYFDDSRKWKERYVVVRANHCLELHDSLEAFVRGSPPRLKLLPTGGTVLTTEEAYMAMVDQCFPDDTKVKEDFGPPLAGMPGQFPVYLRLPYRTDSYFCFRQQDKQAVFLSILSDCIRHQNQDFLNKKTSEVQAFLKAIQLYRQDKDKYEAWGMLIGSDVRVMANEVMEHLLPSLEVDLLPRLKAKKTEKRRVWFATVEAAYVLVQEHLLEGLSALKEECRTSVRQQEVLIHSDMDQILSSRRQLEEKVRAKVWAPAERLCSECVQPYLGSVLEELMEPVSSGFQEGRQLSERMMDRLCQDVPLLADSEGLRQALADMARPNLLSCYQKIGSLQEKLQQLQQRFGVSNITGVIHSAQIDLQQLAENAAYTFEQLLHKAVQDNPDNPGSAIEKAKHRVLKQYDYDSSTVRKRISREALVLITLPFIKKNLAPTCKTELQGLEQFIDADHSNFIHVENVYESVLLQSLDKEVTKVVKEAASLKKYNLFTDSRDLLSQSSRSSFSSPSVSTPGSPAMVLASPSKTSSEPQSRSPHPSSPPKDEQTGAENGELKSDESDETDETVFETPLQKVEQILVAQSIAVSEEAEATLPRVEDIDQTVKAEAAAPVALATLAFADSTNQSETQEVTVETAPETVIQEEDVKTAAEPQIQSTHPPKEGKITLSETPTVVESTKTDVEAAAAQTEAPVPSPDTANEPVSSSAGGTGAQTASSSEEETHCERSEIKPEAPSGGQTPALPPADIIVDLSLQEAEPVNISGPNSLDVSVGSESAPSDVESLEGAKTTQSSGEDKVSTTSDVLEDDANISKSPESSDDAAGDETASAEPSPRVQTEAASGELSPPVQAEAASGGDTEASGELSPPVQAEAASGGDTEASGELSPPVQTEAASDGDKEASVELSAEAADATTSPPAEDVNPSSPEAPPDCIKQIRDLVTEVIEVEELVQRYPDGVPNVEE
ncbi:protein Niban 1a isoform X3 [Sander lucioperca]|uniref:protein Niban 1a isoform X3 n=1 Tax=Sander lucioperca TaxID=283035 RepID=UPI00125E09D4|nr:protein Niban 1a isoform X3 [Sander lucioperca]